MMCREDLYRHGLAKLAEDLYGEDERRVNPERSDVLSPDRININPLRPPTELERTLVQGYNQAGMLGALAGGATGVAGGALFRKNPLTYGAIGAGTGLLAGLARHYDQRSDPPGLSPVYTVPAGASLGLPVGALAGAALGKVTRFGTLPGALVGAGAGATGGAIVSGMV